MNPQRDSRLEKVEQVTIDFQTFKKVLARSYLGESNKTDRSFVLRLYPPFEAEMEAEYYESIQGRHYDNNWDETPFHIKPELLILEGDGGNFRDIVDYPEEWQIKQALTNEEIQEEGGMEACMEESKQMFWEELKTILPDTYKLGYTNGVGRYEVQLNWTNTE